MRTTGKWADRGHGQTLRKQRREREESEDKPTEGQVKSRPRALKRERESPFEPQKQESVLLKYLAKPEGIGEFLAPLTKARTVR